LGNGASRFAPELSFYQQVKKLVPGLKIWIALLLALTFAVTVQAGDLVSLFKDINPSGGVGSDPTGFTLWNNKLYFSADDGSIGVELWFTDGTAGGTTMLKDINPSGDSDPYGFTLLNNKLYFVADDGTNGVELWVLEQPGVPAAVGGVLERMSLTPMQEGQLWLKEWGLLALGGLLAVVGLAMGVRRKRML